jgi:class 3 adenylate cyclase
LQDFLTNKTIYSTAQLKDKGIAIGTIGNGLLILDDNGNLEQVIDEKFGIISNNISCLYAEQKDQNNEILWLCTDKGISKVEYFSPVKEFTKNNGIKGFVADIIRYKDYLYLATTEGVYYLQEGKSKEQMVFTKMENISQSAWRFLKLKLDNGGFRLYVCTSGNILEINEQKAIHVKGDYVVNSCIQLDSDPAMIYLGLDRGLAKANIQNGKLVISGPVKNSSITDQIRTIIEGENGDLWLWGEKDGVMHYDTKKDTAIKFFNSKCDTTIKYLIYSIFKYENRIYMCTSDGILEYNKSTVKFEPAKSLSQNPELQKLSIVNVKIYNETGWALIIENKIKKIVRIDFRKGIVEKIPYKRILDENIWCFYDDNDDFLLIGSIDKLYTFDKNFRKEYGNKYYSLIRKVTINNDSVIFWGANHDYSVYGTRIFSIFQNKEDIKEIKYKYHDLKFEYACPYFEAENALEYSYYLQGNDESWSAWTNKTDKEYTNLYEGEYIFKVKAKNVHGFESEPAEYKFTILPPWYRTIWAYISYLIVLIFIIWGIVKLSVYRLQKINEAYGKYLPGSFLKMLDKRRVIDFRLGDMAEKEMTIMFSDIRSYTNLSESMAPQDNFKFLVSYLKQIGQSLNKNKGFPIQYYGDGIMAMFHGKTDNPVQAAIDMHHKVAEYSVERAKKGRREIKIGVGIHTGKVIMGIRGDEWRWEGGIVGDSVNIASRIEGLTKIFGVSTIITEDTHQKLEKTDQFKFRYLGKVQVKGKDKVLKIYELIDSNPSGVIDEKLKITDEFAKALELFYNKAWTESLSVFNELAENHNDQASKYYIGVINNIISGTVEINDGILIIN